MRILESNERLSFLADCRARRNGDWPRSSNSAMTPLLPRTAKKENRGVVRSGTTPAPFQRPIHVEIHTQLLEPQAENGAQT